MNAAKLVSDALLGYDTKYIVINDKPYAIKAPTIRVIAGATRHLVMMEKEVDGKTVPDVVKITEAACALSWFVVGDESLSEEFKNAKLSEVTYGIETAVRLIDTQDFMKLSTLSKSLQKLIAKAKPKL